MGLTAPDVADDVLLTRMARHPLLVNRQIVCMPKGVGLCRPSETFLDLLDRLSRAPLAQKDGHLIIDEEGNRIV
ncbi:MAG: ArsC/Spx/MgsR family protein [Rhodobacterales bacterium]|nr:ArsC/Spx/MgsR family protein [Rhodobacterales bacterium]